MWNEITSLSSYVLLQTERRGLRVCICVRVLGTPASLAERLNRSRCRSVGIDERGSRNHVLDWAERRTLAPPGDLCSGGDADCLHHYCSDFSPNSFKHFLSRCPSLHPQKVTVNTESENFDVGLRARDPAPHLYWTNYLLYLLWINCTTILLLVQIQITRFCNAYLYKKCTNCRTDDFT